jgi:hypothetical protein
VRCGDVTEGLVKLFVVADGQLQMTWGDAGLVVVTGGVSCKFEDLGAQAFQDSGEAHRGTASGALGAPSRLQETVDTTDRELQTSLGRAGSALCPGLTAASFSFSRHH